MHERPNLVGFESESILGGVHLVMGTHDPLLDDLTSFFISVSPVLSLHEAPLLKGSYELMQLSHNKN